MSGTSLVTARERALAVLGGEPDDATLGRYLHGIAGVSAPSSVVLSLIHI